MIYKIKKKSIKKIPKIFGHGLYIICSCILSVYFLKYIWFFTEPHLKKYSKNPTAGIWLQCLLSQRYKTQACMFCITYNYALKTLDNYIFKLWHTTICTWRCILTFKLTNIVAWFWLNTGGQREQTVMDKYMTIYLYNWYNCCNKLV